MKILKFINYLKLKYYVYLNLKLKFKELSLGHLCLVIIISLFEGII